MAGGRPQGEIRQLLRKAAAELVQERGPVTWRDIAERANVGYSVAKRTVEKMAQAGDLECVGREKRQHARHWMSVYEPASNFATRTTHGMALGAVMQAWATTGKGWKP